MDFEPNGRRREKGSPLLFPESMLEWVKNLEQHANRVQVLALGVVGVLHEGDLGVQAIGRREARAKGLKHVVKQVDWVLRSCGITVWQWLAQRGMFVVGRREELVVALDWTEIDEDDLSLSGGGWCPRTGREPLSRAALKAQLKNQRSDQKDEVVERLYEPAS